VNGFATHGAIQLFQVVSGGLAFSTQSQFLTVARKNNALGQAAALRSGVE
jgi:hypothetical protein